MWAWLIKPLSTFGKWVAPILIEFFYKKIKNYIEERKIRNEEKKKNDEAKRKYLETISNPNLTREERQRAEDEFLNS